jgi:DNA-binding NarL/FixJ family response regulator
MSLAAEWSLSAPTVPHQTDRPVGFSLDRSGVVLNGFLKAGGVEGASPAMQRLTSREREIVQLLADGRNNKQIARLLDLSVKTVETHRAAVMRKLELESLPDLVRFAIRNQIIQP